MLTANFNIDLPPAEAAKGLVKDGENQDSEEKHNHAHTQCHETLQGSTDRVETQTLGKAEAWRGLTQSLGSLRQSGRFLMSKSMSLAQVERPLLSQCLRQSSRIVSR